MIHSAPGSKNPLPNIRKKYTTYVPQGWSVRRTPSGSMTLAMFAEWAKYLVRTLDKEGKGKRHGHPMVLLIDGHSSRWTHTGLKTLIDAVCLCLCCCAFFCLLFMCLCVVYAGYLPFFIGSHTSAWAQPNDCGLNAKYKSHYGL